jgi:hypothetical protein
MEQPPPPDADDTPYYRKLLHELLDIGANVARAVDAQAKAQIAAAEQPGDAPAAPHDLTIPFDRIARAMRRTINLARRLGDPLPAPATTPVQHRIVARRRILREVEDAIQRKAANAEAESLHAELLDRMDGPELEDEIDHRPVTEIIADICRDLGLERLPGAHPWKRRTPADIVELCARAAMPYKRPTGLPPRAGATILASRAHFRGG